VGGKASRARFVAARRRAGRPLLERAVDVHPRADLGCEITLDLIRGPLYYRLPVGHAPMDRAFTDTLPTHALRGVAP
jgi:hypothetical protein